MDYVSLNQADLTEINVNNSTQHCNIGLQDIAKEKRIINFENFKFNIKEKAKKGKRKMSNLKRHVYNKGSQRASLIVHMVTNSPKDPKNLVFLSLILSGVGFLFPYNCLINATDFFQSKFCSNDIIYSISVTYVLCAVFTVFVNNLVVGTIYFSKRIICGYIIAILTMSLFTLMIIWLQMFNDKISYKLTLLTTSFSAVGCAIQQSSFYGYASLLPRRYTQALMVGESLSGVISSILRITTYTLFEKRPTIYFILCIGQLFVCLVIFHLSIRSGFVQHHLQRLHHNTLTNHSGPLSNHSHSLSYQISNTNDFLPQSTSYSNNEKIFATTQFEPKKVVLEVDNPAFVQEGEHRQDEPPNVESSEDDIFDPFGYDIESSDAEQSENSLSSLRIGSTSSKSSNSSGKNLIKTKMWTTLNVSKIIVGAKERLEIVKIIWPFMASICIAYFVTLFLFPGVVTDIKSSYWGLSFPLVVMLIFNVSDFIGKLLTSIVHKSGGICLLLSSSARIPLIPLIICCVIPKSSPIINGDFWVLMLTSFLGLSNGYFGCLPMLLAPHIVKENQKEMAGNLMTTAYNIGLTIGVLSAMKVNSSLFIPDMIGNVSLVFTNITQSLCKLN